MCDGIFLRPSASPVPTSVAL